MARHLVKHPSAPVAAVLVLLMGILVGCAYLAREGQIAYMKVNAELLDENIEIEINRSFLEKYKDRVTISATFTVDKAMQNPVARIFDGDLHMSGRAPEIALPVVAEIANGAQAKKAVELVHGAEGTGRPLEISGVWRIWPEHAGRGKAEQGKPVEASTSSTPKHVFEIHPVTRVNDVGVLDTFKPVEGYLPGAARETLEDYEKVPCKLTVRPKTVLIATRRGLWNDVEFLMEIVEDRQMQASGGRIVIASARDLKGDLLVKRLRMIFAEDTPPERAVRLLKRGGRLHVYGLPRVDFAEVSRRVKGSKNDPALLVKPLPYEIIVQGVYKDAK